MAAPSELIPSASKAIAAAKQDFYDKMSAFVAEAEALAVKKAAIQKRVQHEQDEANRRYALKVAPELAQIKALDEAGELLANAFETWSRECRANISAWSKLNANQPMTEATNGNHPIPDK